MEPRAQNTSDPSYNKNLRIPPRVQPCIYPYQEITQYADGSIDARGVETYNSFHTEIHALGTFTEKHPSGGERSMIVDTHHHYVTGGKTTTTDQNHHDVVAGSFVKQITNDHYTEHGDDHITAIGSDHVHLVGGSTHHHATGEHYRSGTGNYTTDHNEGSHYINVMGDHIHFTGGTKYESISGEYGVNIGGNYDVAVSNSYQINVTTKITIVCGKSKIVLSPSAIDIYSPAINFHQAS